MRPQGREIGGFYAAPPEAVAHAATFLRAPAGKPWAMLDPCAGKGAAVGQLAATLGCEASAVHAIELEAGRAEECREALPEGRVLGPASFFGCTIKSASMSLIWCNPPFDDQIAGGKRVEEQFLQECLYLLVTGGVIALVCPRRVSSNQNIRDLFLTWFDNVSIIRFPEAHRRYDEVVMFGVRRRELIAPSRRSWNRIMAPEGHVYQIPPSPGPGERFYKHALTDEEIEQGMANSPLKRFLRPPAAQPMPAPPLQLGTGHLALLLASGQLDGLVRPPGESPHVVRGVAMKVQEVTDEQEDVTKGQVTVKTTISERIVLTVRAVDSSGIIRTFSQ